MAPPRKTTATPVETVKVSDLIQAFQAHDVDVDTVTYILDDLKVKYASKATFEVTLSLTAAGSFTDDSDLTDQIETVLEGGSCYDLEQWVENATVTKITKV